MNGFFKFLIFTTPVTAIIFFFVVMSQNKLSSEIDHETAKFDRDFYEFHLDFEDEYTKEKRLEKLKQAEEDVSRTKEELEHEKGVIKEFSKQMEKEFKDIDFNELEKDLAIDF